MALSRVCLDTSAYSQFMRGEAQAIEVIDGAEWVGVPTIVLGELYTGFLAGRRGRRNAGELDDFLAHPVVEELRIDHDVARVYAEILHDLRLAGTPLPTNDVWISASAVRAGVTLVTFDAHFAAVTRLGVLHLAAGGHREPG